MIYKRIFFILCFSLGTIICRGQLYVPLYLKYNKVYFVLEDSIAAYVHINSKNIRLELFSLTEFNDSILKLKSIGKTHAVHSVPLQKYFDLSKCKKHSIIISRPEIDSIIFLASSNGNILYKNGIYKKKKYAKPKAEAYVYNTLVRYSPRQIAYRIHYFWLRMFFIQELEGYNSGKKFIRKVRKGKIHI